MGHYKIDKRHIEDILGLTSMQEGMLFQYLSNPDSKQYFEQIRLGLSGKLDIERFKQAWKVVCQSNEILRSVIRWEKLEEPVQITLKHKEIPVRVFDLSDQAREALPGLLDKIIRDDRNKKIDLTQEPLRITLCKLRENESQMILTFHHIIYDGWSNGIVLTEFLEVYNRLMKGEEPEPLQKIKYKEFYKWYQLYHQQKKNKQNEFWKSYLEGFDTRTLLPYEASRLEDIQQVKTHGIEISSSLEGHVYACVQAHNVTFSIVLYAAWGILLQKYNNSNDVIFGTTVSGRTPEVKGIDKMVGLFINTLPIRLKTTKDNSVLEVLHLIGNHLEERSDHEHSSLAEIKNLTGIGKESNLFDSLIVIDNYPLGKILKQRKGDQTQLARDTCTDLAIHSYEMFEMTNFDLTLQILLLEPDTGMNTGADGMKIDFHYNGDLFEFETIKRLAGHYRNILEGITADPDKKLADIQMLSEEETKQILFEYNHPSIEYQVDKIIHGVIEDQAVRTPYNRAVQFGDQWLSYSELNERANQLAYMLGEYGVFEGSRAAMMFPRSIEMVVAVLGILKAGAVCIPLDVGHPDERNRFIIEDSEARFFLKHREVAFAGGSDNNANLSEIRYYVEELKNYPTGNPCRPVQPADLSYIIYTSGSTGSPKGALLHHSGVVNHTYTKIDVLGITEKDTVANNFSINVIASVWQILSPLFTGARLVVYSEEIEWDPYGQFQHVAADGVTVIEVIPSVLKAYLFMLEEGKEKISLEGLSKIALTSEETKPFVVNKFYKAYPSGIQLVDCYGMTECCDDVLHYTIPADTDTKKVPIGIPSLNTRVLVLNHHGQLQPVGVGGEICVIGAGVGYGYWNRPELTEEKFVSYPLHPDVRMYRTGDLGRWLADGKVEYLGRIDHQVKIRGNRVELREIENHVLRYLAVKETAVLAKEDKEGEKNLYAFLVSDEAITVSEIRRYLSKTLPGYMIPAHFVRMEKLPLTPNGKIDRKVLAKMEVETGIATGADYQPPRNQFEKKIKEIWSHLLAKEKIGIKDNFFDLGGHSLLLIKLKSKLEKTFNREISIIELFNYPTIDRQAQYFEDRFKIKAQEKAEEKPGEIAAEDAGKQPAKDRDIAVIGMVLRIPGAKNIDEFWENIITGTESISFFNEDELESSEGYRVIQGHSQLIPAGGVLGDIDLFDGDFFGFHPREAELIDPQQRLFLEYAWMALENSGYVGETYPGLIGVYAGVGWNTYLLNNVLKNPGVINALGEFQTMIGNDKDFLATHISYKLNLKGPSLTVQTACSTSLAAVHLAKQGLLNGECDMALAGGVAVKVPERTGYFYTEGGHLSPDGHCRAFDAEAKGTVFGNGLGIVVLKRLKEAIHDNNQIYAVIKGSAINNDGSLKVGYTSPGEKGQCDVILKALKEAGADPHTIGYVETHGTGTVLGDPVEISALTRAFRTFFNGTEGSGIEREKNQYCAIGSVKANIGHLDVAAGVIGFIKAVLCLKHKQIPPSIHVAQPNPLIDFANSPFYVNHMLRDWSVSETGTHRRASVSSLGIGGTNAHVVLEEWPQVRRTDGQKPQLILLSAKTASALDKMTQNLANYMKQNTGNPGNLANPGQNPGLTLADAAYTLQVGRACFQHRKVLVCSKVNEAIDALAASEKIEPVSSTISNRPIIFMFPGQGSQYVNMGRELYESEAVFREEMDHCFEILTPMLGVPIKEILYPPGTSNLHLSPDIDQTEIAQPVLFAFEYALARMLMKWGIKPYAMIGHSIGEYTAACLSGVFSLEYALKLVAARGHLMQKMRPGTMLSVPAAEKELIPLLKENTTDELSLAAVNARSLCVVSGPHHAIDRFEKTLKTKGYDCSHLHTSHAFHSPMMDPILNEFEEIVKQVPCGQPGIPYISNVTGDWVRKEVVSPEYWSQHLRKTVRFADGIDRLLELESSVFIEIGPGKVLGTFVRQHSPGARTGEPWVINLVRHPKKQVSDSRYLLEGIGRLWLYGVEINWNEFHAEEENYRIPLPTYPFERKRYWLQSLQPGMDENRTPVLSHTGQDVGGVKKNLEDWFYIPSWKQTMPSFGTKLEKKVNQRKCWLFFLDESGPGLDLPAPLIHRLLENKQDVIIVKAGERFEKVSEGVYVMNPGGYDDYAALLEDLQECDKIPGTIVHLWLIDESVPADYLERGVYSLLYLVKALGRQSLFNNMELWVVSNHLHKIEKGDICSPEKATILGPCKVISQEYPHIICRSLDIDIDQNIVENLFSELDASPPDRVIAYRADNRWVQTFEPIKLAGNFEFYYKLRENGVYFITGGLGKIGLILAEYLAHSVQAKLLLTGRSNFPAREKWEYYAQTNKDAVSDKIMRIRNLEEMGAEVLVVQADVSDKEQMRTAVKLAEDRFGTIHGVIHAAGVMDESYFKLISDLSREDCEAHFKPKIQGVCVLDEIFKDKNPDFCILTSSLSSILGGLSLYAYSAANSFMDTYALKQMQMFQKNWSSMNWDEWEQDVNPAEDVKTPGQGSKIIGSTITREEGKEVFKRALVLNRIPQIIISCRDLQCRLQQWVYTGSEMGKGTVEQEKERGEGHSLHKRPQLQSIFEAPGSEAEKIVEEIWEGLLGIESIGVHDDFFELGGHSLLATKLVSRLREIFRIDFPLDLFFDRSTIRGVVEHIAHSLGDSGIVEEIAKTYREVELLTGTDI
ncbi:MAG: amino acid adenylation domain-containing protein [Candidatus Aminicenantes bacterium]|nr:amino acid adenylation domain-containing protein [Candidatus Aminicenantes bacterium]NIM79306.1 amino acid adenylation domain-containing protein [Candidatus Aminicenantes bacterium]NIN23053.1 amino acid adenylation domain-containing protein [Candidatus Aminicenantes bacterium]NIN46780.1 amino acid adenylation domain-containing protein [Candidatus Aminicenantes bacterium]NIN89702.1 amino acid adenylation domain-containing protein [Candidatus Aminicenantes bacterium]